MLKQLSLWPMQKESPQALQIWQSLNHEQQNKIIMDLAILIRKIVRAEQEKKTKGANDEQ